jgi:hypothetical protein
LNKNWREEYGGHLELWDPSSSRCEKRVLPVFNRCVVFSTTESSFHGHPVPLTCTEDQTRKSLAAYYYTNGRPEAERAKMHTTTWKDSPPSRSRELIGSLLPPVVVEAVRFARRRLRHD